jgi:hypothetical protein
MLNVETIPARSFKNDAALRREILELVAPSYEDPSAVVAREWAHCNSLYLARAEDGRLICFFLVAWEALEVEGCGNVQTLYLGLSAARQEVKDTGVIGSLYFRCIDDVIAWERESGRRLILWGTTATPTVYLAARAVLDEIEPRLDGSYSPSGAEIAHAVRRKLAVPSSNGEHPFVLKLAASNTRYSPPEAERISRFCQARGFTLFQNLGVDEACGDRLLFIAVAPEQADAD